MTQGWEWLQGPVDAYELAIFLTGKATYLVTMGTATVVISRGVGVQALLASWGIGEALGEAAGTIAGSTAANVAFTPLHFLAVVYGVSAMETWAAKKDVLYKKYDLEQKRLREEEEDGKYGNPQDRKGGDEDAEKDEENEHAAMDTLTLVLLLWACAVGYYLVRIMNKTSAHAKKEIKDESASKGSSIPSS